jgi:hypothetical protein
MGVRSEAGLTPLADFGPQERGTSVASLPSTKRDSLAGWRRRQRKEAWLLPKHIGSWEGATALPIGSAGARQATIRSLRLSPLAPKSANC